MSSTGPAVCESIQIIMGSQRSKRIGGKLSGEVRARIGGKASGAHAMALGGKNNC